MASMIIMTCPILTSCPTLTNVFAPGSGLRYAVPTIGALTVFPLVLFVFVSLGADATATVVEATGAAIG